MTHQRQDALHHVVLISFKPETPPNKRQEIYDLYQTMDTQCGGREAGILFWKIGYNLDLRKNVHLVEIAIFRDNEALQEFRRHPAHAVLTGMLSQIADWQVGDIYADIPTA